MRLQALQFGQQGVLLGRRLYESGLSVNSTDSGTGVLRVQCGTPSDALGGSLPVPGGIHVLMGGCGDAISMCWGRMLGVLLLERGISFLGFKLCLLSLLGKYDLIYFRQFL